MLSVWQNIYFMVGCETCRIVALIHTRATILHVTPLPCNNYIMFHGTSWGARHCTGKQSDHQSDSSVTSFHSGIPCTCSYQRTPLPLLPQPFYLLAAINQSYSLCPPWHSIISIWYPPPQTFLLPLLLIPPHPLPPHLHLSPPPLPHSPPHCPLPGSPSLLPPSPSPFPIAVSPSPPPSCLPFLPTPPHSPPRSRPFPAPQHPFSHCLFPQRHLGSVINTIIKYALLTIPTVQLIRLILSMIHPPQSFWIITSTSINTYYNYYWVLLFYSSKMTLEANST